MSPFDTLNLIEVAQLELVMVTTDPDASLEQAMGKGYIWIDWGLSVALQYQRLYPDAQQPVLRIADASVALEFILEFGGAGYLTKREIADELMFTRKLLIGFAAGYVATLVFHQLALAILAGIGLAPSGAWNLSPTAPLGIPAVLSLSFWGGIWGIILILVHRRFGHGMPYWVSAFLFGAIVTSIVALFIVVPMKGGPLGGGFAPALLLTVFIINGVWGIAAAWLIRVFGRMGAQSSSL